MIYDTAWPNLFEIFPDSRRILLYESLYRYSETNEMHILVSVL
jgi:hypothetical protein